MCLNVPFHFRNSLYYTWVGKNHPTDFLTQLPDSLHQVEFPDEDVAEGRVSGTVTLHLPKLENVKSVVNSYLETVCFFSVFCLFFYSVYPSTPIIMVPRKMGPSK